jgi:hypothetical protein
MLNAHVFMIRISFSTSTSDCHLVLYRYQKKAYRTNCCKCEVSYSTWQTWLEYTSVYSPIRLLWKKKSWEESESVSYVTTDGQSASLSWYKAPIRGLRPDFYFRTEYGIRLTVTFLIPWGALSDERTGLSFVCAAGPCQRILSRVLAPWVLRPYFTVSDLRLPFSSPPTTRRVTVEVFDPASTRDKVQSSNSWMRCLL